MTNSQELEFEKVEFTKEEYDRIREVLENMRSAIEELQELMRIEPGEIERKYQVLLRIHEEGGVVSKERFNEIGEELGYDKRGLQGLFAWGGKYITMIAGKKVALKEKGIDRLKALGLIS